MAASRSSSCPVMPTVIGSSRRASERLEFGDDFIGCSRARQTANVFTHALVPLRLIEQTVDFVREDRQVVAADRGPLFEEMIGVALLLAGNRVDHYELLAARQGFGRSHTRPALCSPYRRTLSCRAGEREGWRSRVFRRNALTPSRPIPRTPFGSPGRHEYAPLPHVPRESELRSSWSSCCVLVVDLYGDRRPSPIGPSPQQGFGHLRRLRRVRAPARPRAVGR